jgi:chaperonin GroEL
VRERKDRVDDAMHATRAAVEEDIAPGGGVALLRASEHLKGLRTKNDDQKTGVEIVRKALSAPARQIAINAGEDGSVIVGKILEKGAVFLRLRLADRIRQPGLEGHHRPQGGHGFGGVRVAIQNAASVAALLITTRLFRPSPRALIFIRSRASWRRHETATDATRSDLSLALFHAP